MRVWLRFAGDLRRHELRLRGASRGIVPRHFHRRVAGTAVEADLAITQCERVWSMKSSRADDDLEQLHYSAQWASGVHPYVHPG